MLAPFSGVKVFSATKAEERNQLGETISRWMREHPDAELVDRLVLQSSDNQFHCLTFVLFYKTPTGLPVPPSPPKQKI